MYNHGSQLGLVQGGLASDGVSLTFMRNVGRKWRVDTSFGYSRSVSETAMFQSTVDSYSTSSGITYQLAPDWTIDAGYSYVKQSVDQTLPFGFGFDRNVFHAGIKYTFQRITAR